LAGTGHMGDGIPHFHFRNSLDTRDDIPHISGADLLAWDHLHFQNPHFVGLVDFSRIEKLHLVSLPYSPVHDPEIGNDATKGIEDGIKDERLQGSLRIAFGRRDALYNGIQHLLDTFPCTGANVQDFTGLTSQQVNYLILYHINHGRFHVNFVQDGDDLQAV